MSDLTPTDRLQSLGCFIRTRRQALRLTQTELATRLSWVQERISVLESGRYGMPSLQGLALLATGLEIDLAELIEAAGFPLKRSQVAETEGSTPI